MRKSVREPASELEVGVVFIEFSPAKDLRPVLQHVAAQLAPAF